MRAALLTSALLVVIGAACTRQPPPPGGRGQLDVQWNGANGGQVKGTPVARWCAYRSVLLVQLVQGDTGIALALYPGKELRTGVYPVVDPARAESIPPSAGFAVRWLTRTTVQGFQGDSGRVRLERSPTGLVSGQVHARARSVVDTQRIRLIGTFRDLTVMPDTLGCDPADTALEDAESEDIGVD